jgi:hypothetical protein
MKIKFNYFARNIEAGDHIELFLISAVAAILFIRFFLNLVNYLQIGGESLHIAHMLWGGLLMTIAIIGLITFLNRQIKLVAAVISGIGFGIFIDELGKFITHDNNYFFQPTIALIYVILILIYLISRLFIESKGISAKESLINAIELIKEGVLNGLDSEEKKLAVKFLNDSDSNNSIVQTLRHAITQIKMVPFEKKRLTTRLKNIKRKYYLKITKNPYFATYIIGFFSILTVLNFSAMFRERTPELPFYWWGLLLSLFGSGVFVVLGIFLMLIRRRLRAYLMFKTAVLISIFLTQFFLFFTEQLMVINRLIISIIVWNVLQDLIHNETDVYKGESFSKFK